MKQIMMYILILFAFIDNIYLPVNIGMDARIQYLIFALGILYYISFRHRQITFNKKWVGALALLIVVSMCIAYFSVSTFIPVIQQVILISCCMLPMYFMLIDNNFNIEKIFRAYIRISLLFAGVGVIQLLSKIIHFRPGYDYSYLGFNMGNLDISGFGRIQSWTQEPSFFAYLMMPAFFVAMARLMNWRTTLISIREALLIVIVSLLTFSSVMFIGILITLVLLVNARYSLLRRPAFLIGGLIVILPFPFLVYMNDDVKMRVDDTIKLFGEPELITQFAPNLSTYALFSNYLVTRAALNDRPLVGSGIGTYGNIYDIYEDAIPDNQWKRENIILNAKDGNSLLIRMLVETGFIGVTVVVLLIFFTRIWKKPRIPTIKNINLWLISNGIFVLLLLKLLRSGHYTISAFWLFILFYYFAHKEQQKLEKALNW